MSTEREHLLSQVREAENPSPLDEARVLSRLRAAIDAGAAPSVEVRRGPTPDVSTRLIARPGALLLKLGTLLLVAFAALRVSMPSTPPPRPFERAEQRVTQPAPVPPPTPTAALRATPMPLAAPAPAAKPAASRALPRARPAAGPRERPGASLRAELELLTRVQAALQRRDGPGALRELAAKPAAAGSLAAELDAAHILALCLLERVSEARTRAAAFERTHPHSAQREAIASSCANPTRIGPP
jgi:hypothetical protein